MDFKLIDTNGIKVNVAIEGSGPLIICVHGFPESWYSWRHQISFLSNAGYTVAAIDVRGYGKSDKPYDVDQYSLKKISNDIIGIIDALNFKTAVLIGHDWGGPIVWHTAALNEDRITAVAGLSVPYFQRLNVTPIEIFKSLYSDRFFYQIYFQDEGIAESEFESDVRKFLKLMYVNSDHRGMSRNKESGFMTNKEKDGKFLEGITDFDSFPDWFTSTDLDFLVGEFEESGFRGPLNRYRNYELDFKEMISLEGKKIKQPTAFLAGDLDAVNFFVLPDGYKDSNHLRENIAPQYENLLDVVLLKGSGHWVQQEKPAEVNEFLLNFLKSL